MKLLKRHAVMAAGMLSLATMVPTLAGAQARTQQQPGADTPRLLIATFRSDNTDPTLGVQSAEAIRTRVQQETPVRQLWVLSRNDINNYLTSSGYKADSALSPADLKELAKLMRADEILDGSAQKTSTGVKIDARLMLSTDISLVQPLPTVEAKNAGDAAKTIERYLTEARKSVSDFKKCQNALRAQKYDEAAAAARDAITKYPSSTLGRLCLMSAYQSGKQPSDSIISAANAVLKYDSTSTLALGNLVEAYKAKNDTTRSVESLLKLAKYKPEVRQQAVAILGQMNKPDIALPFVKTMLTENPGDPDLLRMQWLLYLTARRWKEALAAGEEYVKADTAAATADYFTRSIAAASADSQPQLASQIAARAVQRFPNNADLFAILAQTQRKSGQLEQAVASMKRAVSINPKVENGWLFILVTQSEMGQPDSALASARQALAGGADKATVSQALVSVMGPVVKEGQSKATRESWMRAYTFTSAVDSVAPSPNSKYFVGVSAFQVGLDALQGINKSKSCDDVKLAEDMWANSQIAMPQGAQVDKETAGKILGAIQQYGATIPQAKKAFCKEKKH